MSRREFIDVLGAASIAGAGIEKAYRAGFSHCLNSNRNF
jgi:hypothetical protein